ncbi:MAG: hypothetical protein KGH60_03070 [Candidatus Micrarchaeota archaeon]|nr:hypothetical protein [Candidatus Micrarchaeota archaeon]
MEITEELCEVVGTVIGDGNLWTDGKRYRVDMTGHPDLDMDYFKHLSSRFYTLFGKMPYAIHVREHKKGRWLHMRLQHKVAFDTFVGLGIHAGYGKAKHVAIPKRILKAGWRYSKYTLRGIMDTDGTVFFSKKTYKAAIYPTLEIGTISKGLSAQINGLLLEHGFRARARVFQRGRYNPEYKTALYGYGMLKKWMDEIGFSNNRHINKLVSHNLIQPIVPQ